MAMLAIAINGIEIHQLTSAEPKKEDIPANLKNNTLFNQLSGYQVTGGFIGQMFNYIGTFVEELSGLNDKENDQMVDNMEACKKFYDLKAKNQTVPNIYSKFGDIA